MRLISTDIAADHAYLIPIGDIHVGDRAFGKAGRAKLAGYLAWVAKTPNARIFLMGDIYNTASRTSKTSPFTTDAGEYREAIDIFRPVAKSIIGAITGNHCRRMEDSFGFNPLIPFCAELGIPYLGYSAVIRVRVGKRPRMNRYRQTYHLYAHHTTGGGGSLGASLNRKVKLQEVVSGVDAYLGGHTHQLTTGFRTVFEPGQHGMVERKIAYVDTGSYLDWSGSYAEAGQYPVGKLGSPRIRLDGRIDHHDLHISL